MMSGPWHGMAEVGSPRPVTMQDRAQSQATQCGIFGGERGTELGFTASFHPVTSHPFNSAAYIIANNV